MGSFFIYCSGRQGWVKNYNMKNYILVLIIALFVSACSTSKQFHQAPSLSFKLPKNAKEIAFEDFFKKYNPRKSKLNTEYFTNLYQIDSFYIGMHPIYKRQIAPDELIRQKKGSENLNKFSEIHIDNTNYESTIKKYKNKREVLIETFDGDWYQASFFEFSLIDPARTQLLVGVLQFPKTEKTKATVLLDKFLTSIKFEPTDTGKKGL